MRRRFSEALRLTLILRFLGAPGHAAEASWPSLLAFCGVTKPRVAPSAAPAQPGKEGQKGGHERAGTAHLPRIDVHGQSQRREHPCLTLHQYRTLQARGGVPAGYQETTV